MSASEYTGDAAAFTANGRPRVRSYAARVRLAKRGAVTVAFHRVCAQARHHRLEVRLIGEAVAPFVDDNRVGAEHLTDTDKTKQW